MQHRCALRLCRGLFASTAAAILLLGGAARAADGYTASYHDEAVDPWSTDDYLAAVAGTASTKATIDYADQGSTASSWYDAV